LTYYGIIQFLVFFQKQSTFFRLKIINIAMISYTGNMGIIIFHPKFIKGNSRIS
jgi:hypothetical protein